MGVMHGVLAGFGAIGPSGLEIVKTAKTAKTPILCTQVGRPGSGRVIQNRFGYTEWGPN